MGEAKNRRDSAGRKWAGNFEAQAALADRIFEIVEGHHPIDIGGALQTVLGNVLCDVAPSADSAREAIGVCLGDIAVLIEERRKAGTIGIAMRPRGNA